MFFCVTKTLSRGLIEKSKISVSANCVSFVEYLSYVCRPVPLASHNQVDSSKLTTNSHRTEMLKASITNRLYRLRHLQKREHVINAIGHSPDIPL